MTDFYSELGLERNKRIDEINAELSRLESTWKRREITNPEKATTMLALIIQARKAFASDASRRVYDNELNRSQRQPEQIDPNKGRVEAMEKYRAQARAYYDSQEYDLAKVAIEKAISLSNMNGDDDMLFSLAADIYKENGNIDTAISYINRAIVASPSTSSHYLTKGLIHDRHASIMMQRGDYNTAINLRIEARRMFLHADKKADQSNDLETRAHTCGALAYSYYFQDPIDKEEGVNYARLVAGFGGDSWGNADKVLSEVKRVFDEQEEAKKKTIYDDAISSAKSDSILALENAIKKFASLNGWKDSNRQIEICKNRITEIKEKEAREAEKAERSRIRRKRTLKVSAAVFVVAVIVGVLFAIRANIQHHKCGDNVRWKIENRTLRVYGDGEIYDYDEGVAPWENISTDSIDTILIEDGVTYVGTNAFRYCQHVSNIIVPSSVRYIANSAFCSYEPLTFELPDGLEVLEPYAFDVDLTEIYIPASVKYIDSAAFASMYELVEINVDENNPYYASIDGVLFNKDISTLIEYPKGKDDIAYAIPDSVECVAHNAFNDSKIDDIWLGAKTDFSILWRDPNLELLKDFSEDAYFEENNAYYYGFENALTYPGLRNGEWNLANVNAHPDSDIYSSIDGILFSKDYSVLYWFPTTNENEYYDVPYGVVEIAPAAFYGYGNYIKHVNFPETLKIIGDDAFDGNYIHISEVNLPEGIIKIGSEAFGGCEDLAYIMLPSTLTEIGGWPVRPDVEIHYNGTISDWNNNVTVYERGEVKDEPVLSYRQVICSDGVIE